MPDGIRIQVERLTKTYKSGTSDLTVFDGIEATFEPGERVALVGESGSGKSSLLHLLGALDRPSAGTVRYGERDIFAMTPDQLSDFRNRTIGFVWQMSSLLPEFSAAENAMMPLLVRGVSRADAARIAADRLAEVGLAQRGHHRAGELSGGEQQRVALARALAGDPKALLADEPTGNLDYRTHSAVAGLLRELHRRHGFTTVVVTHNLGFAQSCDRILQLEKGSLTAAGAEWVSGN